MSNDDRSSSTEAEVVDEVDSIENITGQIEAELIDSSFEAEGKIKPITGNINETNAKIKISQESTRSILAYILFSIYSITILLVLSILIFTDKIKPESRKEIMF